MSMEEDRTRTRQLSGEADSSAAQTTSEGIEVTFDMRHIISFEDESHHVDFARQDSSDDHTTDSSSPIVNIRRDHHRHHSCVSRKVIYALMTACILLVSIGTYFIVTTNSNQESAGATSKAATSIEPIPSPTVDIGEDVDDSSMTGDESFDEVATTENENIDKNTNDELALSSPMVDKVLRVTSANANDTSCEGGDDTWFKLELTTDNSGNETSWELEVMKDGVWSPFSFSRPHESNTQYVERICLQPADYKFTIRDAGNDGICCNNGFGSYAGFLLPWGKIFESPIGEEDWGEREYTFTLYSTSSNTTSAITDVPSASPPQASITLFPTKDESSQTISPSSMSSIFTPESIPPTLSSSNQESLLSNATNSSLVPSQSNTVRSTDIPSQIPSSEPTNSPSMIPSTIPSTQPTGSPSHRPSAVPTGSPSQYPSAEPTSSPSHVPTGMPTNLPSLLPTAKPSPQPTPPPTTRPSKEPPTNDSVTKFFLVADCPYDNKERQQTMPNYIDGLEDDGEFLVHLGDLMYAAVDRCRESAYISAAQILQRARMPTFVLPGDNDINDCPNIQHGEDMWMKYFHLFDKKFWSHSFDVRRWGNLQESFAFVHKRVLFLGLNMIGGIPYSWSEKSERHRNHLEQVKSIFNEYESKFDVIVLLKHADPNQNHRDFFGAGRGDGLFIDLIRKMGKPTIHFHGDSHRYYEREADFGVANYMRISMVGESRGPPLSVTIDVSKPNPITVSRRQSNLNVRCCAKGWPRLFE